MITEVPAFTFVAFTFTHDTDTPYYVLYMYIIHHVYITRIITASYYYGCNYRGGGVRRDVLFRSMTSSS